MTDLTLPTPVRSDLRFAWRVDYFNTHEDAARYAEHQKAQGFNVSGPESWYGKPVEENDYTLRQGIAGLFGVHWSDRPGEGWYQ